MQNFLELECLVVDLFFRIINVYQCSFTLNILFDKVDRLRHEKKKEKKNKKKTITDNLN